VINDDFLCDYQTYISMGKLYFLFYFGKNGFTYKSNEMIVEEDYHDHN